ncbi:SCO4225 family membrane protein [Acrocarpospora catenulata]|uniref:SCO4225 family membrane protein n=1 Tax=Acrocarpospora catenulata TaxID=2836182 RepID=UPI001BDB0AD5|nr:hypothetical protein [Acrocarpospora catenulata]
MRPIRTVTRYVSRYNRGRFALALAGIYAFLVLAATIYVEIAVRQPGSDGLEGVLLIWLTAPLSQLVIFIPLPDSEFSMLIFPAVGLLQAWILWLIANGGRKAVPPVTVSGAEMIKKDQGS